MDEDLLFALRLQANERGIFDENLIELLMKQFIENNYQDIEDFVESNFDTKYSNDDFEIDDMPDNDGINDFGVIFNDLDKINERDEYELINNHNQRQLQMQLASLQYQNNQAPTINNMFSALFNDVPGSSNVFIQQIPGMIVSTNPQFEQFFSSNMNGGMGNGMGSGMGGGMGGGMGSGLFSQFMNIGGQGGPFDILNGLNGLFNGIVNMNNDRVPVTLTDDALTKLEDISYEKVKEKVQNLDEDEQCSICFSKLNEESEKYKYNVLPCNHVFHNVCIKEYLQDYDYHCPICKTECGEHEAKI